jgi:SM-20-related protein
MIPAMPADALNHAASARLARVADALSRDGYAIYDDLFTSDLLRALLADCQAALAAGALRPARIGRGVAVLDSAARGDSTLWIEASADHPARTALLAQLDALRIGLNRRLLLGLQSVEAHYAVYPAGACYVRHVDRFRSDDARVLSFTCYLNLDWTAAHGGALRLHVPPAPRDVLPLLGSGTLFLSDEIEHEVLPAARPRYSISGWFRRDRAETAQPT